MIRFILVLLVLPLASCIKQGGDKPSNEDNVTYAVVNGQEIKGKEVNEKIKNDLEELRRSEYEMKRRATEEIVQQKLLEDEAKKQGTTIEKVLAQYDDLRDKPVGSEDVTAFLKQRNIDPSKLTKQEKDSVPQIIKTQRVYEARQMYLQGLRSKANVQFKLPKPDERIVEVSPGDGVPNGPSTAKVTIVEFSDFQCPFCARGKQRLDEIKEKYKDKVKIYFRNYPLEQIHPYAFHAAEAAACVLNLDKTKFWDYHNTLFDHQDKLQEKDLIGYAVENKLDEKAFSECLKSGKMQAAIRKDMEEGGKVGVNSTPTFFVNGQVVRGAQPIEQFSELIDDQLSR